MSKIYSVMIFYFSLNMAAFLLNEIQALPMSASLYVSPLDMTNTFSLTVFSAAIGGGAILGILALITRQYVYASVALVIWVIGIMLPIAQWILLGFPMVLNSLLPSSISYFGVALSGFFAFIFFIFFIELASARQIT